MQRTPRAEAVRPTRRAISPRLAMSTEAMGVLLEGEAVERRRGWDVRRARTIVLRDWETDSIARAQLPITNVMQLQIQRIICRSKRLRLIECE